MIGDWRIAIIGAGMGGLTAAAAFSQFGASVNIFEQADKFSRIGAGIQMSLDSHLKCNSKVFEESLGGLFDSRGIFGV